ncbi:MAG: oxygen-independent coproporphyrinogen III oxidase [Hyphomicrobiaceae bacterium]|nr:MAG: oxygen-independent coproporphyrinogen III oxidase [Hyphomicrobiaceae bacterium]
MDVPVAMIERFARPVPRYTSYPTAPQFRPDVDSDRYREWLAGVPAAESVSLYVHIPFCHSLCWYCGCNTRATKRYDPVVPYLEALRKEIDAVAGLVPPSIRVAHLHWGGGSPNYLAPADITALAAALKAGFAFAQGAEFAIEIDPRYFTAEQVAALRAAGVNRASIGVQDFDTEVQEAINRRQSLEMTRCTIAMCREAGVTSVNIDLIYGLPNQTTESVSRTLDQVIELEPDRVAVFGYAHLPQRFKAQRLIADAALPGAVERFAQSERMAGKLVEAGYRRVGFDHFAKPTDALAGEVLHRNFQGYTADASTTLIGFGASAIGRLPQGYVQNAVPSADYIRRVKEGGLAVVRGCALSEDDRIRAHVIERLMCDLSFDRAILRAKFGEGASAVIREAEDLVAGEKDGLIEPTAQGFRVSELGRPFVRSICARFDAYLTTSGARHSAGV